MVIFRSCLFWGVTLASAFAVGCKSRPSLNASDSKDISVSSQFVDGKPVEGSVFWTYAPDAAKPQSACWYRATVSAKDLFGTTAAVRIDEITKKLALDAVKPELSESDKDALLLERSGLARESRNSNLLARVAAERVIESQLANGYAVDFDAVFQQALEMSKGTSKDPASLRDKLLEEAAKAMALPVAVAVRKEQKDSATVHGAQLSVPAVGRLVADQVVGHGTVDGVDSIFGEISQMYLAMFIVLSDPYFAQASPRDRVPCPEANAAILETKRKSVAENIVKTF